MVGNGTEEAWTLTSSEKTAMLAVQGVAASLSTVGSAVILWFILRRSPNASLSMRLLAWLSVADIISNVVTFVGLGVRSPHPACETLGFLVTAADLAPIMFTACMSGSLCHTIFLGYKSPNKGDASTVPYAFFSFGVPLLFATVGAAEGAYGDSGFGFCWVEDQTERLFFFYIPLWLVIVFNTVGYASIAWAYQQAVMKQCGGGQGSGTSKVHRLKYYPAVLVLTWGFGTVNRVSQQTGVNSVALMTLQHAFSRSQGVFNCLLYVTDPVQPARVLLEAACARVAGCCGVHGSAEDGAHGTAGKKGKGQSDGGSGGGGGGGGDYGVELSAIPEGYRAKGPAAYAGVGALSASDEMDFDMCDIQPEAIEIVPVALGGAGVVSRGGRTTAEEVPTPGSPAHPSDDSDYVDIELEYGK